MAIIPDKFNIIFCDNLKQDDLIDIYPVFQSYLKNIINGNKIVAPDIIHQYLWVNKSKIDDKIVIMILSYIETNLKNYLKNTRRTFRNQKRKHKLVLANIHNFIYEYKKIIDTIRRTFSIIDINDESLNSNKLYWGNTQIVNLGIQKLIQLILSDNIVSELVIDSIKNIDTCDIKTFKNYSKYIYILGQYIPEHIDWYYGIINTALVEYIPNIVYPVNTKYQRIYQFKNNIQYYYKMKNKLIFLKNNKIFTELLKHINTILLAIFENSEICFLTKFIKTFLVDIKMLLEIYPDKIKEILYVFSNVLEIENKFSSKQQLDVNILINFYTQVRILLNNNIKLNKTLVVLNEKFKTIIENKNLVKPIIYNIHNQIMNKLECNNILFDVYKSIKNVDKFISLYHYYLIIRLMSGTKCNLEKKIVKKMEECKFHPSLTYKLKRTISDVENSLDMNRNFNSVVPKSPDLDSKFKEKFISDKFNVIVTTEDVWDINLSEGHFIYDEYDGPIGKYLRIYNKFYEDTYSNKRYLIYRLHVGRLELTFNVNENKKVDLILLPLHGIVLEIFNDRILIENKALYNKKQFSGYSKNFIHKIINSLVLVNILIEDEYHFSLNLNYNGPDKIDVISVFFDNINIKGEWERLRQLKLCHSRDDILSSLINHFLKINKLSYEKLFVSISDKLTQFILTRDLFDTVLHKMIEQDYIRKYKDTELYEKIYY